MTRVKLVLCAETSHISKMVRYCIYFPHVKMSDKRFVSCSAIILIYCCCYLFRDSIRNLHVYFKTMFGSSLPPVVCRRLMSYIYLCCLCFHLVVSNTYRVVFLFFLSTSCVWWCPTHIVLVYYSLFSLSCVPNVASFSGLSILDCRFGFFNVYLFP